MRQSKRKKEKKIVGIVNLQTKSQKKTYKTFYPKVLFRGVVRKVDVGHTKLKKNMNTDRSIYKRRKTTLQENTAYLISYHIRNKGTLTLKRSIERQ